MPALAVLVAVVSRSPAVLAWAATLLVSLGVEGVLLRNPEESGWQRGLSACHISPSMRWRPRSCRRASGRYSAGRRRL